MFDQFAPRDGKLLIGAQDTERLVKLENSAVKSLLSSRTKMMMKLFCVPFVSVDKIMFCY